MKDRTTEMHELATKLQQWAELIGYPTLSSDSLGRLSTEEAERYFTLMTIVSAKTILILSGSS